MKARTLFSALTAAQAGAKPASRALPDLTDESTLLSALRHSATDRDQIIQRRLTLFDDITE